MNEVEVLERDCRTLVQYGMLTLVSLDTEVIITTSDGACITIAEYNKPSWLIVKPVSEAINRLGKSVKRISVGQTSESSCNVKVFKKDGSTHSFDTKFKKLKLIL